ncbi:MAG: hydroxymethylglutaryl-CoA lyase [Deltaproteobacteria bacterium]|nr:MAG: hydroxymethylglutaryl-CoA lyase [Deltaproteobacteria bacterium]
MISQYDSLPTAVRLVEVAPRDGWQNLVDFIPTKTKTELINELAGCGFKEIEVSSFVSPKAIPQLKDATAVFKAIKNVSGLTTAALVPNPRGLPPALAAGVGKIVFFISASDTHNRKNLGCPQGQTLTEIEAMYELLPDAVARRVSISNVFGCPYEGDIAFSAVAGLVESLARIGFKEITLCDTLGVATPDQVYSFSLQLQGKLPEIDFGLHLHDSCGRALACVMAGLQAGIDRYDTSAGGLGGCPYAPGAAGNLATEDLLFCLDQMGIKTGIDSQALLAVAKKQAQVTKSGDSHMLAFSAGCVEE